MATVTMKELLEAGVHFGHQVRRWNPKMKEYIFGERNGIYIIDLQKTQKLFRDALGFIQDYVTEKPNAKILFVGTKRQAQDAIIEEAQRCEQYFVNNRWLGGLMTNYKTVQKSIQRLKEIEVMQEDGRADMLTKKERLQLDREHGKLMKNLAGIKDMGGLPDMLFVIDVRKEDIAVKEANKLNIPVVAVVDTNCSPDGIDYVVPGNDDALRAIRLFTSRVADSILEGKNLATEGVAEMAEEQKPEAPAEGADEKTQATEDKTEAKSEESKTDKPAEPAPDATKGEDVKAPETKTEEKAPAEKASDKKEEKPSEEKAASAPAEDKKPEAKEEAKKDDKAAVKEAPKKEEKPKAEPASDDAKPEDKKDAAEKTEASAS